jgi:hypothetical protein
MSLTQGSRCAANPGLSKSSPSGKGFSGGRCVIEGVRQSQSHRFQLIERDGSSDPDNDRSHRSHDSAASSSRPYGSHQQPPRPSKNFPVGNTSLSLGLSRRRQPQVRLHHHHPDPVRIAFHTLPADCGSIIARAHVERNHFQGSGRVGDRVPRVAAEAATRG